MTEADWLISTAPQAMLAFLRNCGKASDRKLRLFLVACARTVWDRMTDPTMRRAVETAERFADGCASSDELVVTHGEVCQLVYRGPHIHKKLSQKRQVPPRRCSRRYQERLQASCTNPR
jgi:hypothetical protein